MKLFFHWSEELIKFQPLTPIWYKILKAGLWLCLKFKGNLDTMAALMELMATAIHVNVSHHENVRTTCIICVSDTNLRLFAPGNSKTADYLLCFAQPLWRREREEGLNFSHRASLLFHVLSFNFLLARTTRLFIVSHSWMAEDRSYPPGVFEGWQGC